MGKHTEWRKLAKKARRKRMRQILAQQRCALEKEEQERREKSPTYQIWLKEQTLLEEQQVEEEERLDKEAHQRWIEAENRAQEEWQLLQSKLKLIREERVKHQALIKLEWEKEQKKLMELKEKKMKEEEEKSKQEQLLKDQLEAFIENGSEMPEYLNRVLETNPSKSTCHFFKKVGACRFGDTCSRNHQRPSISSILLIPSFYSHISLEQTTENEYGSNSLEFDSDERYNHFKEFFYDVLPELEKYGRIKQFKVCCNGEPHLRGNVYVEYSNCREAMKAYRALQARWYGGKQLNLEFCGLNSWRSAICGLFFKKTCPKGSACNFLHVFRNPGNLYHYIDKDPRQLLNNADTENDSTGRNWRWSESPERPYTTHIENKESNLKRKSRENGIKRKPRRRSRSSSSSRRRHRSKSSRSKSQKTSHKRSKR